MVNITISILSFIAGAATVILFILAAMEPIT